ncbi:hypothetical protein [Halorubrum sp. Atlit-26R]|uniref:hypothetical protein n=1 Tax=Halorubrum sp. Atlit-26R TaxID=2282128 RepID=UPI000EF23305|nr:hypothetical protein [Halorubrum sp. Atlit-26R]RLM68562.1 hypothetical protein DVK07_10600 [Halorubrum sp. Atlit-26R]
MAQADTKQSTEDEDTYNKVYGWVSVPVNTVVDAEAIPAEIDYALAEEVAIDVDTENVEVDNEIETDDGDGKQVEGWVCDPVDVTAASDATTDEMREALLQESDLDAHPSNVEIDSIDTGKSITLVEIHGLAPEEIPASVDREQGTERDMAVELANDLNAFIKENYPSLDHDGVAVAAGEVPTTAAPDYPE